MRPPTFDRELSFKLDRLIIALEDNPPAVRRAWLHLVKRWHERSVPPFPPRRPEQRREAR